MQYRYIYKIKEELMSLRESRGAGKELEGGGKVV